MNVIQEPSATSLSSMLQDFVISSSKDVLFEVVLLGKVILKEVYTPDARQMIYIRGRSLGKTLQKHLHGTDFEIGVQDGISADFRVNIDNVLYGTYKVLKSRVYTYLPSSSFFDGSIFLNLCEKVKWTTPEAKEYLTCVVGALGSQDISVSIVYRNGPSFGESSLKPFYASSLNRFATFDTSFPSASRKFPEIEENSIVAYKIHAKNQVSTYYVDRVPYLLPLQFIYKNGFDVPDTIITRGIATRKGVTSFDTSKIHDIVTKSSVKRSDQFTVSSGKIFSTDDYDRYRDMFNSTDVRIFFKGKYRKVIISEERSLENLRLGSLVPLSFSFEFADEYDNNILLGEAFVAWILEQGIWDDNNAWLDNGIWLDEPL